MKFWSMLKGLSPLLAVVLVAGCVGHQVVSFTPDEYDISNITAAEDEDTKPAVPELPSEEELLLQEEAAGLAVEEIGIAEESGEYADGAYTGSGTGFAGTVSVSVLIEGGQITSVSITGHSDGDSYMAKAKTLISNIISGQTTNVDTVSGATYSSRGIISAVRNALNKARVSGNTDSTETAEKENVTENPAVPLMTGTIPCLAGVYEGTAEGYLDDITVRVVISKNTITEITVTEENDDDAFFSRASSVINDMIEKQTAEVDTVSGATYSSKGIINAVKAALLQAEEKTSLADLLASRDSSNAGPVPDSGDSMENTDKIYKDGIYRANVLCIPDEDDDFEAYHLSLMLTIEKGRIVSITDIAGDGDSGNDSYINRAANGTKSIPGVVTQILNRQSADGIDAVSRATCSSKAIIEGVQEILSQAVQ